VQLYREKLNELHKPNAKYFDLLDNDNINIKSAEKILNDFDVLQESEPNNILKKFEEYNVIRNFDLFNSNLTNFCLFSQKDKLNQSASISLNYKDNLQDMNNKSNLDLQNLRHQLDNLTSGILEINENSILRSKVKEKEKDKDSISIITPLKSSRNFHSKLTFSRTNCKEKEIPIPQHSFINSSSAFINNMPTMQTDSSFLSNYDDNYILNNYVKGKKRQIKIIILLLKIFISL